VNVNAPGGIAPEADIVAVRVFGSGGAEDFDILSALAWVADNAATYDIAAVNLSLGSGLYLPGDCYSDLQIYPDYFYRIVFQQLIDAGVAPLVASGNDEIQNRISSPACIEPAISVGSTNAYDTSNNSYEGISYFTNISTQLDLLAPGHNVMSSLPGDSYGLMSGTSMATPVTAGAFALLQSVSQKPVNEWLNLLKNTGTPLDGDYVSDIPRLNIDWAACEPLDCLVPPTNIDFTTSLVDESVLSWDQSAYGVTPLNFDIEYGDNSFSIEVNVSQTNVSVTDFAEVIRIRSRSGANVSDWATLQPFRFSSTNANKIKTSSARQIVDVELAGDYCTSEVTPYIKFKYESPVTWLRKIWVDGANGFTSYTETKYTPENGELLDTDNKTKQIVINDPVSVINSSATAHVVNSPFYGPSFSLEDLFSEIEGAEYSPSAPTGLVATGGPSRAALTWDNDSSGNWKVLVDGEIVDEVSTPSALVSLTPGDHEVSVCSVKTSGQNTYTSIKASTSVTALAGQFQEIEGAQVPSLNAGGQSGPVTALSTSGLNLSYSSQTSSVCEVDSTSGVVTPIAQGDCTVRISQSGNGTYAAANPIDVTFEIAGELPGKIRSLKSTVLSSKVKLTWKTPTNFISSEVLGYKVKWRVKLKGKAFTSWKTVSLSANKLSYTSKKYAKGSMVQFQVYATSPNGLGLISKISKLIK
jgi:hypothetical protein